MIVMDYHAILLQLGITPNYKGYHQMLTALEIVEANPEALTMVTKWLYPAVAKRHQTNWKQVERNLRIAVRTAWGISIHIDPVENRYLTGLTLYGIILTVLKRFFNKKPTV